MPRVTVILKGEKLSRTKDNAGNNIISPVRDNDILIFSYTGYAAKEVAVKGISAIDKTSN